MAWGLEARVPFLDKAFLEVAMNVDPKEKMFSKGKDQEVDADGRPKMEKVSAIYPRKKLANGRYDSTSSVKHSTALPMARYCLTL